MVWFVKFLVLAIVVFEIVRQFSFIANARMPKSYSSSDGRTHAPCRIKSGRILFRLKMNAESKLTKIKDVPSHHHCIAVGVEDRYSNRMGVLDSITESSLHTRSETDVELSVPLVEATLIGENQTVAAPSPPPPPQQQQQQQQRPAAPSVKVRVNVTAPSTLPPGYVMQILYQEKDESGNAKETWKRGIVTVPVNGQGVEKGEVFEAEALPFDTVKQIRGHWLGSEFDFNVCCCSPTTDADFCMLAWCCSPVAWACLFEQLVDLKRQNLGKKRYRPRLVAKSLGFLSMLFVVLSLTAMLSNYMTYNYRGKGDSEITKIFVVVFVVFGIFVRSKIREHYSIKGGNCIFDCLWMTCFSTCSVLQSYHQMKKAHEHPHLGYLPNEPLPAEAGKLV